MNKRVIFHDSFYEEYTSDPAADTGRMEAIIKELKSFEIIEPDPATDEDILLVHTDHHLNRVKNLRDQIYPVAVLAVGGAILSSELALNQNETTFAVIRPPGHHASRNGFWGFCYFNNIAIAIQKLLYSGKIQKALVVDFDLHFGDGTDDAFSANPNLIYYSCKGSSSNEFISNLQKYLDTTNNFDIIGVSAGFDRHVDDWGGLLSTDEYLTIGKILKEYAKGECFGRRFGVLEGGYNHDVLGKNVKAFIDGFY